MHMFYAFVQLQIFGKAEFLNPGGSVKDRVAAKIVDEVRIPVQVFVPSFDSPADSRVVTIGSSYPSLVDDLLYEVAEKSSASPFCKIKSETRENSSLMKHTAGTRIWGSSDWRFSYRGQCWKYSSEPGHGSYCTWLQVPCSPP
jgi:hypothetical protein